MSSPASGHLTDISGLSSSLGVPLDGELYELALTHRSFAYEHGGIAHNERLEFLGDAVLGQAVTVMLYRNNPSLDEGDLAKRRASVVSTLALAEVARSIGLGKYIRLGNGEELTGGRNKDSILADTVEALFGATYLTAGPDVANDLVLRVIEPLLDNPERFGASMDPKTSLQEISAKLGAAVPVYSVEAAGPDHARIFTATVTVGALITASGTGTSKKHAEMAAALSAWNTLSEST
ncbi:ribonuclease-3 [Aurantimicrobium minutum]|uniref:ribonuclease III n=1 Tax=Aurantimicrobium minutum TaxID=708131 RepID=UPI0024768016|nr:ribonuclease III [Aurantimicrobium minutum]MDH6533308.1 ribonuclease-3 [Aurantimicrobium minutum]